MVLNVITVTNYAAMNGFMPTKEAATARGFGRFKRDLKRGAHARDSRKRYKNLAPDGVLSYGVTSHPRPAECMHEVSGAAETFSRARGITRLNL